MMIYYPETGQGLVEYAFLLVLIAIVVILAVAAFGMGVGNMFSTVIAQF
ncbi:MAG: pilus assembly protein [Anaerolineales bacterium]|nr:pilus assembly protein [Anaerolineales bacterium]